MRGKIGRASETALPFDSPLASSPLERRGILERGFAPLLLIFPLPLLREGGNGDRF